MAIKDPHIRDTNEANNSGFVELMLVAIAEADVKISGQSIVGLPDQAAVSEDIDVTLHKTLHNNGPYGPVEVSISASVDLSLAPGCTAIPDPGNSTSADLPVSTDVVVDEVWTIHCAEGGDKTLHFDKLRFCLGPLQGRGQHHEVFALLLQQLASRLICLARQPKLLVAADDFQNVGS